ncbi:trihelix transcription factor ASIL2-like [Cucurbita pepo subsp. pepo]|uniref:trihelix transcription factor ASIL2-like n=1 Tax=Cucurbita pepo subsp. pepo TaxID=3664 RepID=UPI000C9D5B91|nr:trihelix transcription factor ASIL2-like [Cucurbita pepo subsp. pepo]
MISSAMGSPSSPIDGSPSSSHPSNPLQALPLSAPLPPPSNPPPQATASSRRLPPPCWSHDETIALIDSYRDKWYSLRRGNLKATHWQDVADSVSHRCPNASPPKTAVQCRHKMEKLRKRYRTELQRARSMPLSRFTSSWVHFKRMDAMEKGPSAKPEESDSGGEEEEEEDEDDQELYEEFRNAGASGTRSVRKLYGNGITSGGSNNGGGGSGGDGAAAGGFRIRIPTGVSIAQPGLKNYPKAEQKMNPNSNPGSGMNPAAVNFGTRVVRESNPMRPVTGKRGEREREGDPVAEMVSAIKTLGDGFVRMERMKMEMAREIEAMRMEMEIKRTEMILDSQQRIVEAFAKAVTENKKKAKRIPSPEA